MLRGCSNLQSGRIVTGYPRVSRRAHKVTYPLIEATYITCQHSIQIQPRQSTLTARSRHLQGQSNRFIHCTLNMCSVSTTAGLCLHTNLKRGHFLDIARVLRPHTFLRSCMRFATSPGLFDPPVIHHVMHL